MRNINNYLAFISQIEPKSIEETENGPHWMLAMEEKLNQFKRNNVWILVETPLNKSIIEKNKLLGIN